MGVGSQLPSREDSSQQQQAASASHSRHLLFHSLIEKLPVAAYTCDPEGWITYFNPQAAQLWGRTPNLNDPAERFCGSFKLLAPDGSPIPAEQSCMALALQKNQECNGQEMVIERLDGRRLTVLVHASPIRDELGQLLGGVIILVDITEHKRTEQALRQSEARYRAIFDNAVEGFFQTTPEGRFLTLNPALAHIYGYDSPEEMIAHVQDISRQLYVDPNRRQEFIRLIEAQGMVKGFEFEIQRKDGRRAWVSESARTVRDAAGQVLYYEGTVEDITQRKETEAALQQSQARYYSLVENLPVNLFRKNRAGQFIYVNQRFCQLLGQPLEKVIGKTDFDFFPPELAEAYRRDDQRVMETNTPLNQEEQNQPPEGEKHYVQVIKVPVRDRQGQVIGVQGIFWDITDRKQAEEALRESEKRFRMVWNQAGDGMRLTNADGIVLLANEAYCSLVELPREAVEGQSLAVSQPPEQWERVIRQHRDRVANRTVPAHMVRELTLWNGKRKWLELTNSFLETQPPILLSTFRDITERKQAEEALRASEKRYANLVNNLDGIVWEADAQTYQFRFVSLQAERILGYPASQWVEEWNFWLHHLHPEDRDGAVAYCLEQTRLGIDHELEYRMIAADGRVVWFHDLVKVETVDGKPVTLWGIAVDVTARKRAEEERRQLEARIQHTQKLESLGVLAGGIAHDFNNLLTSMLGYASLAQMQLPGDSPAISMLQEIEKAAQRAAELTEQMLAYSGRGKFVIQLLRLDTLVQEMIRLLQTVVSRKASLCLQLEPATIEGDATQIRQVVMNLITNASEALEGQEGFIHVRTGVRHLNTEALRSPFLPEELPAGIYAHIEVEDTGCGMTEKTLNRIFDPFFTTKFTGRGLGLAAVLGIVKGHRGTIKVTSTPGKGSCFQVLLPSYKGTAPLPDISSPATSTPAGRGLVLIVEDESMLRTFARHVLQKAGFQVLEAGDGFEGLELFRQHQNRIAVVLLDLIMPRLDGKEMLRELRRLPSTVPVLVMSGYGEMDTSQQLAGLGASDFIQKPFTPQELLARLHQLQPSRSLSDCP